MWLSITGVSPDHIAQNLNIFIQTVYRYMYASKPSKTSPAKCIKSRSNCYKQLNELSNLKTNGVITEDEYVILKRTVVDSF